MKDSITTINDLRKYSSETEWLEFKSNHQSSEQIGERISALANSACLHQQPEAYLIFGIDNKNHNVIGTTFDPKNIKGKGNEDLESWLLRSMKPTIEFQITEVQHPDGRVVIFFIKPSSAGPIKFNDKAWIRIGSYTKPLSDYPEKESILWQRMVPFEERVALEDVSSLEVDSLLDYDQYFRLSGESKPQDPNEVTSKLCHEGFLKKLKGGRHITNLGGIVLSRNLVNFPKLKNKAARIITYKGINRLYASNDLVRSKGYSLDFEDLLSYIQTQIPGIEKIEGSLRTEKSPYPIVAIREFVANALVHQDFSLTGTSPLVEIFTDRIEIYNPGEPLIEPNRFIDMAPKSRNEKLNDVLRRLKICEKRGSGVDRAIAAIEIAKLPAPKLDKLEGGVRVTIYAQKELSKFTKDELINTCYYHCVIQSVVNDKPLTNSSLCERLGIEEQNKAVASRIIKNALNKGLIKPFDPENRSNRYAKYLPYWY